MDTNKALRLVCDPGLEDICAAEAQKLQGEMPGSAAVAVPGEIRSGMAYLQQPSTDTPGLLRLRTAYYILQDLGNLTASGDAMIPALADLAAATDIPGLATAASFRVCTERFGDHPFASGDVNRRVGAVIGARTPARVQLDNPELTVRVDIRNDTAWMGIQLHPESLDKRYRWAFRPRVTLRTTIAAGMLQMGMRYLRDYESQADAHPAGLTVVDPCCGSGTILLEAAAMLPDATVLGGDIDEAAVAGSIENALAAGVAPRLDIRTWDATHLEEHLAAGSVDLVVTNPPFGVRLGARLNFRDFYLQLLQAAARILRPGGGLVLLAGKKRGLFNYLLRDLPEWRQMDARVIEIGGSFPGLFVLQRV
ncbi:methyltransferase [Spirochaeta africana]|uniref:Putative N6-adenine-specific DNA methylase n=1 Tax=Spirochaeta africana (strain ATCC 700263 / DSM 8902 / Z-7692) TaxID=889378 RepID=H9UIM7_SPIAZ|nr:THUMP domain-containing protein [Spirochaeta africana]AFG37370.1 putative N6-adenine-specific DNA methylase [Spirochaeta africana DSM 8902]